MSSQNKHEFEGVVKHVTDSAFLIDIDGSEHWLPIYQIDFQGYPIDYSEGDEIEVKIPEWLAVQKGLF